MQSRTGLPVAWKMYVNASKLMKLRIFAEVCECVCVIEGESERVCYWYDGGNICDCDWFNKAFFGSI